MADEHGPRTEKPADGKDGKGQDGKDQAKDDKPRARWPLVVAAVVLLAFIAVVVAIILVPSPRVWTDDAYVQVHYASIAPRISGQVTAVAADDNDTVAASSLLVQLDDRDQKASVAAAEATLARDQAQFRDAIANVARQPSLITQQEADVSSAKARLGFSQINQKRYSNLASTGAGSGQDQQQTTSQLQQDQASVQSAQAALEASRKQLDVLKQQQSASEGTVKGDQAQLDQAKLNLSYTRILAPVDGMVGQRSVEVGNIVSPGAQLMVVVPLDQIYIEANYREVDLRHVRPGQHVTVHVDAYDIDLDGVVNSVPPASGATFANIAPNNATGNFTKIVQRLPVKIVLSPNQPLAQLLRVGFSVETTIHTGLADVAGEQQRTPGRPVTDGRVSAD